MGLESYCRLTHRVLVSTVNDVESRFLLPCRTDWGSNRFLLFIANWCYFVTRVHTYGGIFVFNAPIPLLKMILVPRGVVLDRDLF